ncbi:MAG: tetratricopeptide repeat protein [Gammaproteobacteria bacterium]|jgi:serine/threonine-protein kinase|nr:tetratricopeptide repeat protein [Gammaproteobacteria bacterium]
MNEQPSRSDWQRIGELFDRLVDLPPEKRDLAGLDEPPHIVDWVERMLEAADSDDRQLLDHTVQRLAGQLFAAQAEDFDSAVLRGRRFGPWEALDEIGRGGMAVVMHGRRADGRFDKDVAIKVLPAAGTARSRERLVDEIRILALLEHPNIARLIDGGVDEQDTPYLVMEYVEGLPITEYCRRHALALRDRVTLLSQVAEAVGAAHRQLIVHCDIKPSNILVDARGQARLVDFGIAALVSASAVGGAGETALMCSPAYCAPEQLEGRRPAPPQDIYGLGAVLFELLAGERIRDAAEATRLLFHPEQARRPIPSPATFNRAVDRDLAAICLRALDNDPGRRYRSADAFGADLERWSQGRAVHARDGGMAYRWGKWFRRNWLPVSLLALVFMALVSGASLALWQAQEARTAQARAEQELERATAMTDFVTGLFEAARPGLPADRVPSTRDLLLRGAETAETRFADQPGQLARMLTVIGELLTSVGLPGEASEVLDRALEVHERRPDADPGAIARARLVYGESLHYTDRLDEALVQLERAVEALRGQGRPAELARALHAFGFAASNRPRLEEALAAHAEALELQRRLDDPAALALGLSATARTRQRAGEHELAAETYRESIELLRQQEPLDRYSLSVVLSDYGVLLRHMDRLEDAQAAFVESLEISEGIYSGPHVTLGQRWNNYGAVLASLGDRRAAIDAWQRAREILEALEEQGNRTVLAGVANNLGFVLLETGQADRAEAQFERSLELLEATVGRNHGFHVSVSLNLGRCLADQARVDEAEAVFRDALARAIDFYGEDDSRTLSIRAHLGGLRWRHGRDPGGLTMLQAAHDRQVEQAGVNDPASLRLALELAEARLLAEEFPAARELFRRVLSGSRPQLPPGHLQVLRARVGLAEALNGLDQPDRAGEVLDAIEPTMLVDFAASHPLRARLARLDAAFEG